MSTSQEQPERDRAVLSPADAELLDRLLEAGGGADRIRAASGGGRERAVCDLLGLIGRSALDGPEAGLAGRTLAVVVGSEPVSLSDEDGQSLDGLMALRQQGLADGPMPAGAREHSGAVAWVLGLLDRVGDEPVPRGLVERTLGVIERDRAEQRRDGVAGSVGAAGTGQARPGGLSLRQVATTAALLLMVLSVLLPMLDKGQRDAGIAACSTNLAGLGADLHQYAQDVKAVALGATGGPSIDNRYNPSAGPVVQQPGQEVVPPSRVNLIVLINQDRFESEHFNCPTASEAGDRFYNGQNPIAGGPLGVFDRNDRPIFADTNPLYRLTGSGLVRIPELPGLTRSKNHDGAGQNVLISDGSVRWMVRPAVQRDGDADNIWLLQRPVGGGENADAFLTP